MWLQLAYLFFMVSLDKEAIGLFKDWIRIVVSEIIGFLTLLRLTIQM